ncbi:MAG: CoA-binding protein, partial [bacterium]
MSEEICEVSLHPVKDEIVEKVLKESKTIAVVGLSMNPEKDSHKVPAFLQKQGYRVIPVHPTAEEIL